MEPLQQDLTIVPVDASGYADAAGAAGVAATKAFEALGKLITTAIAPLRKTLTEAIDSADEVELSLSLAMTVEGKWVILSSSGNATISAKLVWKK